MFVGIGQDKLMRFLDEKLQSSDQEIVLQTIYVIVNVSTGSESHKSAIMSNESILNQIQNYMVTTLPCHSSSQ